MAVYVNVTLMVADTEEELIGMARALKIPDSKMRIWNPGGGAVPYYELTPAERKEAVRLGTVDEKDQFQDCLLWLRMRAESRKQRIQKDRK